MSDALDFVAFALRDTNLSLSIEQKGRLILLFLARRGRICIFYDCFWEALLFRSLARIEASGVWERRLVFSLIPS